jgi:hypothetical protein
MLALVEQLERDDPAAVGMRLDEFPWLTADRLMVLQVEAGRWAGQLGENVAA